MTVANVDLSDALEERSSSLRDVNYFTVLLDQN